MPRRFVQNQKTRQDKKKKKKKKKKKIEIFTLWPSIDVCYILEC